MDEKPADEFLSMAEACEYLGVEPAFLRRVLRQHGLGEFMRGSLRRQVLIRKSDLAALRAQKRPSIKRRGAA